MRTLTAAFGFGCAYWNSLLWNTEWWFVPAPIFLTVCVVASIEYSVTTKEQS